jgi:hypothetical protein
LTNNDNNIIKNCVAKIINSSKICGIPEISKINIAEIACDVDDRRQIAIESIEDSEIK